MVQTTQGIVALACASALVMTTSASPTSKSGSMSDLVGCSIQEEDQGAEIMLLQAALSLGHTTLDLESHTNETEAPPAQSSNGTSGASNLCFGEHLLPELYVIGAQKSATTSFSSEIVRSDYISWWYRSYHDGPYESLKEHHVFNKRKRLEAGPENWFTRHAHCTRDARRVAFDMTPDYLSDSAPSTLLNWYGALADRLRFVVLLREPLSRMHSGWHHLRYRHKYDDNDPELLRTSTFGKYAQLILERRQHQRIKSPPYRFSMYHEQLTSWFASFDPKQFLVVPFLFQVARSKDAPSVADHVLKSLGLPPVHGVVAKEGNREHASLDEDLPRSSGVRKGLEELFENVTGPKRLASLFANRTAELYNYTGSPADEEAISKWLSEHW